MSRSNSPLDNLSSRGEFSQSEGEGITMTLLLAKYRLKIYRQVSKNPPPPPLPLEKGSQGDWNAHPVESKRTPGVSVGPRGS